MKVPKTDQIKIDHFVHKHKVDHELIMCKKDELIELITNILRSMDNIEVEDRRDEIIDSITILHKGGEKIPSEWLAELIILNEE